VLLLAATPGSAEGDTLLTLACTLHDPWVLVRWVPASERDDVAKRFDVRIESEPALYLVWGSPSGALRDEEVLSAVWKEAGERVPE